MNNNRPSSTSRPKPTEDRYLPGDPIPLPDAIEANTESTWALFADVQREPEPEFLDTVPASMLDEELTATLRKRTE